MKLTTPALVGLYAIAALLAPGCRSSDKGMPLEQAVCKVGDSAALPPVPREFRAAWVATVANIDWPSRQGLSTEEQQAELRAMVAKATALNMNAIILQVRPVADALYDSPTEPWSSYITGTQGQAPEPYYDPLAYAVAESHAHGIELHAWFNPFRAKHTTTAELAENHIYKRHPEWVRQYGKQLWLDPGEPAVIDYVMDVLRDMVHRYDIDGVHVDDYFYPYQVRDDAGEIIDFPDDDSWAKYVASGGTLARDDWRRDNINRLVRRMYETVKAEKPHVKVGISPFGIWRPGHPEQIKGFDAYAGLYADSKLWLEEGWVDYFTPQLYWPIDQVPQSFPVLLKWWVEHNPTGRHIWPGSFTSRVGDREKNWPVTELANQIYLTRAQAGAGGNVHFSMKPVLHNRAGLADVLQQVYAVPALIPACSWLDDDAPPAPSVAAVPAESDGMIGIEVQAGDGEPVTWWVVQARYGERWSLRILPATTFLMQMPAESDGGALELIAVTAVDRCGNASAPAILENDNN